jgi:hypothetical protein
MGFCGSASQVAPSTTNLYECVPVGDLVLRDPRLQARLVGQRPTARRGGRTPTIERARDHHGPVLASGRREDEGGEVAWVDDANAADTRGLFRGAVAQVFALGDLGREGLERQQIVDRRVVLAAREQADLTGTGRLHGDGRIGIIFRERIVAARARAACGRREQEQRPRGPESQPPAERNSHVSYGSRAARRSVEPASLPGRAPGPRGPNRRRTSPRMKVSAPS